MKNVYSAKVDYC